MECTDDHRYEARFGMLPRDQGGSGRHRCCGCAYDRGYALGVNREEILNLDLDTLPESQAGTVRHKSPQAAFAQGYYDGVVASY